jgi:hypothetical protein
VPLIALLYRSGGFGPVLSAAAIVGTVIFISAIAFLLIAQSSPARPPVVAE